MGGASRFIVLLTTPFPCLLHRPRPSLLRLVRHSRPSPASSSLVPLSSSPHRLAPLSTSRPQLSFPVKASRHIHTQTSDVVEDRAALGFSPNSPAAHPWAEWSQLVDALSARGYFDHQGQAIGAEDKFVAYEELSDEFVRASSACLAFASDRSDLLGSLSRSDIGVVVENGTAFLFKSALDTARRMRAFLGIGEGSVMESDKGQTVDLMKYLLSYASSPTVSSGRSSHLRGELVESSVRNLLNELARLCCGVQAPEPAAFVQHQFSDRYGQTPRPLGQKIEMKRGDWICPRCSFMNFARNVKCLECEEARPKRQLTGREWECPQCDFYNYGRNTVCLRCDCKRPGEAPSGTTNSTSGVGYGSGVYANRPDVGSRLAANEEKAQQWFSKVSQLDSASDFSSAAADEDFPEIMPLRKGVNRFVVSTRKTPLERRLANSQYHRNLGDTGNLEHNDNQTGSSNTLINQRLDKILGRTSAISDADKESVSGKDAEVESSHSLSSSASPQFGNPNVTNRSYVPFVPLPNDMFAKKAQEMEGSEKMVTENIEAVSLKDSDQATTVSVISDSGKSVESTKSTEKLPNQAESQDKSKEQDQKSQSWFKKLAELHDTTGSASAISDEEFPEIMPMRKGENRFVVSKKKDRSLTSPMYKRRMAMEQAGSTNFVPFVPFPPDYFAKKDKQQSDGADSIDKATGESSSDSRKSDNSDNNTQGVSDIDQIQRTENQQTSAINLGYSGENLNERDAGTTYGSTISGNAMQNTFSSKSNERDAGTTYGSTIRGNAMQNTFSSKSNNQDGGSTGFSGKVDGGMDTTNSIQQPENQNIRSGWTGKSLEGSAVQEPDPLDMSEEAKAQRWFRRVAQIKDISELSSIPDEDFPSIMPMRKGVNRFVVSKRKTPLERRLTSPQYRRNLPVVSSDTGKKENENS